MGAGNLKALPRYLVSIDTSPGLGKCRVYIPHESDVGHSDCVLITFPSDFISLFVFLATNLVPITYDKCVLLVMAKGASWSGCHILLRKVFRSTRNELVLQRGGYRNFTHFQVSNLDLSLYG
jgi:hypothetical protein